MSWPTIVRTGAIKRYGVPGSAFKSPARIVIPANDLLPTKGLRMLAAPPFRRFPITPPPFGTKTLDVGKYVAPRILARLSPAGRVLDAIQVLQMMLPTIHRLKMPEGLIKTAGDFYYPYPYNGPPKWTSPNTIYSAPLTGQYVPNRFPMVVPPGNDPFGIWIPSDIDSSFNAHMASFKRVPGIDVSGEPIGLTQEVVDAGTYGATMQPWPTILPGGAPGTVTAPLPYWAMPYAPRHPLSESGQPSNLPAADGLPYPGGEPVISSTFVPGKAPVTRPEIVTRKPPPKGTKERKATMKGMFPLLHGVIGGVTETVDAIDAIHSALPKEYQAPKRNRYTKHAKPQDQLAAIYDHFDKVDIKVAIENLAKNEMEDRLIGAVNKRMTKNLRKHYDRKGSPFGITVGPAI